MKAKTLFYNAKVHTQADFQIVDSLAVYKNKIVAVGNNLQFDPDFKAYHKINLRGKTIIPGLVDAHTHFYFFALSLGRVQLDGLDSIQKCLIRIKKYAETLKKNEWLLGEGYSPDQFKTYTEPDRLMLDKVSGGRPAFIFSKDNHSAWVNSKALQLAGVTASTPDPDGGKIIRFDNGEPSGLFREASAYNLIYKIIPESSRTKVNKLYKKALEYAYKNGVTGVHSFDSPKGFEYFATLTEKNKLGLRIDYYFPAASLPELVKNKVYYGTGNDFLRLAGIKIFSDGALGSQTALCFNKYIGSKSNRGIEVTSVKEMVKHIKTAGKLGFPCAIHAIGDKAVSNVLDAFEQTVKVHFGARHRIEHLQLMRKSDLKRVKSLGVVASMQPSHCTSDIKMTRKYWGKRAEFSYMFNSIQKQNIDLAFGSDAPIEPLLPLQGIAAAVTRAKKGSKDVFYPNEKITPQEALYNYTIGPAIASGQAHCRGYLLEGYPADFVIISEDIVTIAPSKLYDIRVLATILDGKVKYSKLNSIS